MNDRLSIRLGPLASAIDRACKKSGMSRSDFARLAIAEKCGVKTPLVKEGYPEGRKRT